MNLVFRYTGQVATILVIAISFSARAETITFDLDHTLGPIRGVFGEGQSLSDHAEFFPDRPITLTVGDTLIFNILFDQRLEYYDFGEPTVEVFTFGLDCGYSCNGVGFSGNWTSSVEALGARGDIWDDPIRVGWTGGGGGFGWGGVGVQVTESQGSIAGIRWTTTFTSIREGDPLTVSAFTGFSGRADGFRLVPLDIVVSLDIKPGSDTNPVNPVAKQTIPVAVLTTQDFDASQLDLSTITFGPNAALESHERAHIEDVDLDGLMDMVLHFNTQDTGIACGDTEATLTGETYDGRAISGTDSIVTVNCD
jgi:hypothetical protein